MSVTYGFYNSQSGDRKYDAIQMSSIFDGIIEDGIIQHYGNAMIVQESEGMTIKVGTGRAWFNHTWTLNDATLPLEVPQAEVLLNRYDAVVLEVDSRVESRANAIKIVKGTPASSPVKPTMISENDRWQYPLAYIYVGAGVTAIRQGNITNCIGTAECPYVTAPLDKMSIDDLVAQWQDEWSALYEKQKSDIETWKAELEGIIDTDTALSLANNILKLQEEVKNIEQIQAVTLYASGWSGSAAPYTQTVSVDGLTSEDGPICVSLLDPDATLSTQKAYVKAFGIITSGSAVIADGKVTFKVYKKPSTNINVGLKGV